MSTYYGNETDARAYWTDRGMTIPVSWTDANIVKALQVASEWIDGKYETSFSGLRSVGRSQDRAYPRYGSYDREGFTFADDEFPRELLEATYQAAFRQMTTAGSLSVDFTPSKYRRAAVDGAVSVEYFGFNAAHEVQTQYEIIDRIMAPILTGKGAGNLSALSGPVGMA